MPGKKTPKKAPAKPAARVKRPTRKASPRATATKRNPAADSKQAKLITLLRSAKGATLEQMMELTGWQAHSVRGVISGALKKRLGMTIESAKNGDGDRVYRVLNAAT